MEWGPDHGPRTGGADERTALAERIARPSGLWVGLLVVGALVAVGLQVLRGDGSSAAPDEAVGDPVNDTVNDENVVELQPAPEEPPESAESPDTAAADVVQPLYSLPSVMPEGMRLLFTVGAAGDRPFSEIDRVTIVRPDGGRLQAIHLWLDFDIPASPPWPDTRVDLRLGVDNEAFVSETGDIFVSQVVSFGPPRINLRMMFVGVPTDDVREFVPLVTSDIERIDVSALRDRGFDIAASADGQPVALLQTGDPDLDDRSVVVRTWGIDEPLPDDAILRIGEGLKHPMEWSGHGITITSSGGRNGVAARRFGGYVEVSGDVAFELLLDVLDGLELVSPAEFVARPRQALERRLGNAACGFAEPSRVEPFGGLHYEIYWGDLVRAQAELDAGAGIDAVGSYWDEGARRERSALTIAIDSGCLERVIWLVERGADPRRMVDGSTGFERAEEVQRGDIVLALTGGS